MKHIGIIAEYNPFHNGHFYQLQEVRKKFPDKEILVMMSGNYVQRGEPAIFDKYLRTQMALAAGIDMVIELPFFLSTQSAEIFARGAILSLYKTGMIDTICFGAECNQTDILYQIADVLVKEPAAFRQKLQELLSNGLSFPKARSIAVANYLNDARISDILCKPNNILAIEYLKAIQYYHLPIHSYILKRSRDDYHNEFLPEYHIENTTQNNIQNYPVCSATALRKELMKEHYNIASFIPENALLQLIQYPYNRPLTFSDFYIFLQKRLMDTKSYDIYQDISPEFANRLSGFDLFPTKSEELLNELSCKNITRTRICRGLLHILLNCKKETINTLKQIEYVPYFRLLGFKNTSSLPKQLKESSFLPMITKVANYKKILSEDAIALFEMQLQADICYRQIYYNKYNEKMPSEYKHSVIIGK